MVDSIKALRQAQEEMQNLAAMVADSGGDAELKAMAEDEFQALKERIPDLERAVQIQLLPKDEADEKNAILEVRAGTGCSRRPSTARA